MQDVLTYEAWLQAVCDICNNLLKANISITGDEFQVVASKYRWRCLVSHRRFKDMYEHGREPSWGATELMRNIIEEWDKLLVEEDNI